MSLELDRRHLVERLVDSPVVEPVDVVDFCPVDVGRIWLINVTYETGLAVSAEQGADEIRNHLGGKLSPVLQWSGGRLLAAQPARARTTERLSCGFAEVHQSSRTLSSL